jgi:hypothetical protein
MPVDDSKWLEDQKEDVKDDKKFALRADLKVKEPTVFLIEPLQDSSKSLLSADVKAAISAEIASLAHHESSNKEIYQVLKRVIRLGDNYEQFAAGNEASSDSVGAAEVPSEQLDAFTQIENALTSKICQQVFSSDASIVTFFQDALNVMAPLPALALTSTVLPGAFSYLAAMSAVSQTAKSLLVNASHEAKSLSVISNVVLESAIARGSLSDVLAVLSKMAHANDVEVLKSTVQKYTRLTLPDRQITERDSKLASILKALREKEGKETKSEVLSENLKSMMMEKLFCAEAKTSPSAFAVAIIMTQLERFSSSFGPSIDELEFISGKRDRVPLVVKGPGSRFASHGSWSCGGSQYGISFEIRAKKQIVITGFDCVMSGDNQSHRVFHREGSISEQSILQSQSGWTEIYNNPSHPCNNTSAPVPSVQDLSITCLPGSTHSFYFWRANSSGMQFGQSLNDNSSSYGAGSNDAFDIFPGRYSSGSSPFESVNSFYQWQGIVKFCTMANFDPVEPPASPPAPLQLDVQPQIFQNLANILDLVSPVFASGGEGLDDNTYLAHLNTGRSALQILRVHIYQYSLSKTRFVLSEPVKQSIRINLERLQKCTPAPRNGFNLGDFNRVVRAAASEAFSSAIALFYPTCTSKFQFCVNQILAADEKDSMAVSQPFRAVLVALASDAKGVEAYPEVVASTQSLFDAILLNPTNSNFVSSLNTMADNLFNYVWSLISSQQVS